jgi:DNA-binding NarL/FixJ family response regulator
LNATADERMLLGGVRGLKPIRVLIVDDSSEFLRHAGAFLLQLRGVELAGWAYLGREALDLVGTVAVDLMIVDVSLPGMGGLEVTRRVKALPAPPRVVLVTLYDDPQYRAAGLEAGADGYVTKKDLVAELPALIESLFPRAGGNDEPPPVHHLN